MTDDPKDAAADERPASPEPPIAPEAVTEARPLPSDVPEEIAPAGASPVASRRPVTPVRILAAATSVLAVASVLLGWMVFAPGSAPLKLGATRTAADATVNEQIEDVAADFARSFVTIDYRTLDADFARIRRNTVGKVRRDLARIQDVIADPYRRSRSSSRGLDAEAQVVSRSGDTASVQVVVRFSIRNADQAEPRTLTRSLELTLVKTSDGWKVADAGQPSPPILEDS